MTKKQKILAGVVSAIVLLGVGAFIGRNFIADLTATSVEQDPSLNQMIDQMTFELNGELQKQGSFVEVDAIHKGEGMASVYSTDNNPVLIFEEEFKVTNGPDLVVYLSPNTQANGGSLGDFVSLGDLHSAEGKQAYSLPENYQDFKSIVIWCRAFGVLFSYADLEAV